MGLGQSEFDEAWEDDVGSSEQTERLLGEAILNATIHDLDPKPAVALGPEATVREAVQLMRDERIGALLVTRDERPVGIFTERDVLRRVALSPVGPDTRLAELMTADPETVGADDGIAFALNRMILGGFRHVPVVDQDGRAIGVLSLREVVGFIVAQLPGRVLNLPPHGGLQAHSPDGG